MGHLRADQTQHPGLAIACYERQQALADTCHAPTDKIKALIASARIRVQIFGRKHRGLADLKVALDLAQRLQNPALEAQVLSNFGCCHLWRGDYAKALVYQQQAVASAGYKLLQTNIQAMTLSDLGLAYAHQGQIEAGIAALQAAIELTQARELPVLERVLLSHLSLIQSQFKGDLDAGIETAKQALKVNQRLGDAYFAMRLNANLAIFYAEKLVADQAEQHLQAVNAAYPELASEMQPQRKGPHFGLYCSSQMAARRAFAGICHSGL